MKYVRPNQGVHSKQRFKGVTPLYAPIDLLRLTLQAQPDIKAWKPHPSALHYVGNILMAIEE
jgi:hypothetical protein